MMRKILIAASTALLFCFISTADAATSGNDLFNYCEEAGANWSTGFCGGYISGIAELATTIGLICPSDAVNNRQAWDIVRKYLEQHPETRDQLAEVLVFKALTDAFPCPKKPN
jgi:hypothetical protein